MRKEQASAVQQSCSLPLGLVCIQIHEGSERDLTFLCSAETKCGRKIIYFKLRIWEKWKGKEKLLSFVCDSWIFNASLESHIEPDLFCFLKCNAFGQNGTNLKLVDYSDFLSLFSENLAEGLCSVWKGLQELHCLMSQKDKFITSQPDQHLLISILRAWVVAHKSRAKPSWLCNGKLYKVAVLQSVLTAGLSNHYVTFLLR